MRGPMLATIHKLHDYLNLIRAALEAGTFGTAVKQFHADRARAA